MNWKNVLLLLFTVIFAIGLFRVAGKISEGKKRLAEIKSEVAQTLKQKQDLEEELKLRQSPAYLEKEARNRLNLIKPGERIVILPKKPGEENVQDNASGEVPADATKNPNEPNWVKWKRLFFN